jgi:hypothetical protein
MPALMIAWHEAAAAAADDPSAAHVLEDCDQLAFLHEYEQLPE